MILPYPRIEAVIFDFDGTLTEPGAINFVAIKKELNCPPAESILEFLDGLPQEDRLQAEKILEKSETLAALNAKPNFNAEPLIAFLRAQNVPIGLLTRNTRNSVVTALESFQFVAPSDFQIILTRADVKNQKPHPEGVYEAAKRLGVLPAKTAVVGDYRYDVEAGQNAGAVTFYLTNGAEPPSDVAADYFVATLAELQKLLEQML